MSRELKVLAEDIAAEVAWLNRMPAVSPETAVIQVTSLVGALRLRRTCFDQYQESMVPAQGGAQETVLVDGSRLAEALKAASGSVIVTFDDGKLSITSGGKVIRLRTADLEFPVWPQFQPTADQAVLRVVQMASALTSVGTDDTLPMLMAVSFDDGSMVTTDRFRLTRIRYGTSGFTAKVPSAVLRAFTRGDGVVFIQPGYREPHGNNPSSWVQLKAGGRTVTAPAAGTEFPEWKRLIPDAAPVRVAVRRDDLLAAASGNEVVLTITPDGKGKGTMTVRSVSHPSSPGRSDGLEVEQEVKLYRTVRYELDSPLTVTLRSKYVTEVMRSVDSALVLLDATASDKPVMFQDVTETDLHLVMPVREAS